MYIVDSDDRRSTQVTDGSPCDAAAHWVTRAIDACALGRAWFTTFTPPENAGQLVRVDGPTGYGYAGGESRIGDHTGVLEKSEGRQAGSHHGGWRVEGDQGGPVGG